MGNNIGKQERDVQIQSVIKSNLVSVGLTYEQINHITEELTKDILDILDNFYKPNQPENTDFNDDFYKDSNDE